MSRKKDLSLNEARSRAVASVGRCGGGADRADAACGLAPTLTQAEAFQRIWHYFNERLFGNKLQPVMLNFSRGKSPRILGFFAPDRWTPQSGDNKGKTKLHEISLNPATLARREPRDVASTIVHEMVHQWQQDHGKPSRSGYHNGQWAAKMEAIGLMPSATGEPGGARVGQSMTHYVIEGAPFATAYSAMPADWLLPFTCVEALASTSGGATRKKSKVKYTCPSCSANAWAKPDAKLMCGECEEHMVSEDDDGDGGEP